MADPAFFPRPVPLSIAAIVELTGAVAGPGTDLARGISGISALETAGPEDAAFSENRRYANALAGTRAGLCFAQPQDVALVPAGTIAMAIKRPQEAFVKLAAVLFPTAARPQPVFGSTGVSPDAHVHPEARIETGVTVEPGAVIGPRAAIGQGTLIAASAVVGPDVQIGRDSVVGAGAVVTHAFIGNRVIIHPGARIGQEGFGFIPGAAGHRKIPQIGRVILQDDVEIGANSTVDRGSVRDTVIGEGTKIDNLVQVAHNVVIGRHCFLAGMVGIAGSATIGDFVSIGGAAGIAPHVELGTGSQIAAGSGVSRDVPAGARWAGYPAVPAIDWVRQYSVARRLARSATKNEPGGDGA
jgi:UDP-3-O-[3-hydroxymyristoyl] glucosamine N-acyltransferase